MFGSFAGLLFHNSSPKDIQRSHTLAGGSVGPLLGPTPMLDGRPASMLVSTVTLATAPANG
eukprot:746450-Pleurochrysis_carterae.AAC.1